MIKINNIAVIYGGSSSEREISLQSGEGVYKSILDLGYKSDLIDYSDLKDISFLKKYDFVFIALHGFEGESGELQRRLDRLNIRYSGSGFDSCRNTWSKLVTKRILRDKDISTPSWKPINKDEHGTYVNDLKGKRYLSDISSNKSEYDQMISRNIFGGFGNIFLKPDADGSSVDIHKIYQEEEIALALKNSSNSDRNFFIEEGILGREFTVTIIDDECYPPIEIITKNEFYDYDAKYLSDETLLVEAELYKYELKEIKKIALDAFNALNCKSWGRVDLMQNSATKDFYVIEINTVPGMTSHSCVPKSGSLLGLTYNEVVQKIIDASL